MGRNQLQKQRRRAGKHAGSVKVPLEGCRGTWPWNLLLSLKTGGGSSGDGIRCSVGGLLVLAFEGFSVCDVPACWCHLLADWRAPCHLCSKWAANGFRFPSSLGCDEGSEAGAGWPGAGRRVQVRSVGVLRRTGDLAGHRALSPDGQASFQEINPQDWARAAAQVCTALQSSCRGAVPSTGHTENGGAA